MNKFLALLKVQISELFDFTSSKQKKKNSTTYIVMLIISAAAFLLLSSTYAIMFYGICKAENNINAFSSIVIVFISVASLFSLFTTIYQIKSFIYDSKDYDFLSSLPLKRSTIVTSKITLLYLFELATSIVWLITPFILYGTINPIFFIFILPLLILIPIFPTLIASLLALLISFIEKKIPFGNIIKTIISILLMILIIAFSFMMNFFSAAEDEELVSLTQMLSDSSKTVMNVYPLLYLIKFGFIDLNPLFMILYLLLCGGFLALTLFIITKSYYSIRAKQNKTFKRKIKKELDIKYTSKLKTFFTMDLKKVTSSTTVLSSVIIGSIMSIFFVIIMGLSLSSVEEIATGDGFMNLFILLLICFSIGITPLTTFIISLEGKTFWIIKTSPIDVKKYFISKLLLNHLFFGIGALISSIVTIILFKVSDIPLLILTLILPQLYIAFISALGLIIGIYFVRLEWTNERMLMKNSASTLLVLLFSTILDVILGVASILSYMYINSIISFVISLLIVIGAIAVTYTLLFTKGIKRFNKIEC